MDFRSLGLSEPVLKGVADAGYESPTEIQERAIPLALAGRDLIALGQTGSGKTAAFGLPLLETLAKGEPGLRALILVPTRELCVQVAENLRVYAAHTGLHVRTAFGGIPITIQEQALKRGVDVLVACPGRLLDHVQIKTLTLDAVQALVLDEADRMLDMGFMPQIRRILARLPQKRQNMMFSATMPKEIERLVADHFGQAETVQVGTRSQAASTITHRFESVHAKDKEPWLERFLRDRQDTALIFVKTKKRAEELGRQLQRGRLPADSIHGDKSAESRHVVLKAFERGKVRFLVATDVAARGLDVSDIGTVVNFDMPRALEDYVHRVGRTGRAGSEGEAVSLVTRLDGGMQRQILAHLEKTSGGMARAVVDGKVVLKRKAGAEDGAAEREPENAARNGRSGGEANSNGRSAGRGRERAERDRDRPRAERRHGEARPESRDGGEPRGGERRPRRRRASAEVVELSSHVPPPPAETGFGVGIDAPRGERAESDDRSRRRRRSRDRA